MADKPEKDSGKTFSDDPTIDYCVKNIKKIQSDNKALDMDRVEALRYYRGETDIVEVVAGRSKVVTTDMQDLVEWAKPSLLEVFASSDDVVSLEPVGGEDTEAVEKLNILVLHQLKVKNNWFLVLHDWFDDMLKLKTGAIKYQWHEEKESFEKDYEGLTQDEYEAKLREPQAEVVDHRENRRPITTMGPQQELLDTEEVTHDLTLKYTIEDAFPLIEACPAEDVGFSPRAREIKDTFVYHKVRLKEWQFKKKYGKAKFNKVKKVVDELDDDNVVTTARYEDVGGKGFFFEEKKDEWVVYECYYRKEEDGTPMLVEICGEVKCSEGKNKYQRPPFHVITPIRMAHRVSGYSFYDLVKDIQKIRTAMLRQIMDNTYFANNRRYFGDANRINMTDYLGNNFPGAFIRTIGDPRTVVVPEEKAPLPPELFQFWEMLSTEKDYHTGLPRSFQGVNPSLLNRTFRGQNQQVSQAAARMHMMARLIAESGIAPLISDVVNLNIRFLNKKTVVRYLNSFVEINPDNIVGKYDVVVNVGLGNVSKDLTIQYMQQLLGIYAQAMKMQAPFVTADNAYYALKQLIKAMGYKNTADYVTDPKISEGTFGLIMALVQKGAVQDPQIGQMVGMLVAKMGLGQKLQEAMNQMKGRPPEPREMGGGQPGAQPGADVSQAQGLQPAQPAQPVGTSAGGGFFG